MDIRGEFFIVLLKDSANANAMTCAGFCRPSLPILLLSLAEEPELERQDDE